MTQLQADLGIALLAAHVISDFLLQTERTVEAKKRIRVLVGHCVVVALLSYLLVGLWTVWQIPLAVFVTHLLMDYAKRRWLAPRLRSFAVDQVVHLGVIAVLVWAVPRMIDVAQSSFWNDATSVYFYQWLLGVVGFLTATFAGSVLVGVAIKPFQRQAVQEGGVTVLSNSASPSRDGFPEGGRLIGLLERALIFVLVVAGQPAAIGFLIAAKSILRFGEIGKGADRKDIEYILIGTLMSFLVAVAVSYLTRLGFVEYGSSWPVS